MDTLENNECMENEEFLNEIEEPRIGMEFNNIDEFQSYYHEYGNKKGFPVRVRSTEKDVDGNSRYVILACGRTGTSKSKAESVIKLRPMGKCGCNAKMRGRIRPDGTVKVTTVSDEHNHDLSPGKSRYYSKNRVMSQYVKKRLEYNDRAGIRPNKSFTSCVVEAGGNDNLTFSQKDCYNYLHKIRQLRLGEGDASALHNYFQKMQANNAEFFYLMDLDETGRLRNVFWADAWSRAAYKEFGDAITFDTTYLTNKYEMPFAPFVGVNHHGQSILLGCGLICSETVEEFVWLFKSWLVCMNDRAPDAIITDQDRAMKRAIEIVFPNTCHRWCLWHIMKKLPEKLSGCNQYEAIKFAMQRAVYDSLSHEEFEEYWYGFIEKFNLQKNDWLSGLYNERIRWVPTFQRNTFWAGMSSTQRSESMNVFFDGYVNSKTTLKQFVEQYENTLRSKVQKEVEEDFKSFNRWLPCLTPYEFEKKFQAAYTTNKFKEFQTEIAGRLCCAVNHVNELDGSQVYYVSEDRLIGSAYRSFNFKVYFNNDDFNIQCNCQLFEFRGILCKHILSVLSQKRINVLPEKFILRRWRKDVKRCHKKVKIVYSDWAMRPENERFDEMCSIFYEMADIASEDQKETNNVKQWLQMKLRELKISKGDGDVNVEPEGLFEVGAKSSAEIHSPLHVRCKGRRSTSRMQSTMEKTCKKKKKKKKNETQKENNLGSTQVGFENSQFMTHLSATQGESMGSYYSQPSGLGQVYSLLSQRPTSSNDMESYRDCTDIANEFSNPERDHSNIVSDIWKR